MYCIRPTCTLYSQWRNQYFALEGPSDKQVNSWTKTNRLSRMALTEKQQENVQVCENNLVRRIMRVKRVDKRRMGELRVEVGVN